MEGVHQVPNLRDRRSPVHILWATVLVGRHVSDPKLGCANQERTLGFTRSLKHHGKTRMCPTSPSSECIAPLRRSLHTKRASYQMTDCSECTSVVFSAHHCGWSPKGWVHSRDSLFTPQEQTATHRCSQTRHKVSSICVHSPGTGTGTCPPPRSRKGVLNDCHERAQESYNW